MELDERKHLSSGWNFALLSLNWQYNTNIRAVYLISYINAAMERTPRYAERIVLFHLLCPMQSTFAARRRARYCQGKLSVRLSVTLRYRSWSYRLEFLENNFTAD